MIKNPGDTRRNLPILFYTMVVVMLGFGMVIPIMPFYIKSFGASGSALGLLMATYAIMQFIFSPVWGGFSDRYGRKPILMLGILGNALAQLMFGLSTSLWMLFLARTLAGVLSSATLPTAMAYISDSTSAEERGDGMGKMGAAMGIGMLLGPGIAGWLATRWLALPFFLAAGLSLLALLLVFIFLPESLPESQREKSGAKFKGPDLKEMWQALYSPIGVLLFLAFLVNFGLTNFEGIFGLYALERYGYGPQEVGYLLTFIGVVSALVQGGLTGPLTKRYGEVLVIKVFLAISAIGFVLMTLPEETLGLLLAVGFFMFGNAMLRPAVSSLTSRRATIGQGAAMGLNNAFMSLGRVAGPLWGGFVFDYSLNLPYLSGAVIMLAGLVITQLRLQPDTPVQAEADPGVVVAE
jgi:DHA1 family multidrug resistance protein-like MFS transporter